MDGWLYPSTKRHPSGMYEGVIRDKNKRGAIVWSCGHHHKNRDNYTVTSGPGASMCAFTELGKRKFQANQAKKANQTP